MDQIREFILIKCKLKAQDVESVMNSLEQAGIDTIEYLSQCDQELLKDCGLNKFQAGLISRKITEINNNPDINNANDQSQPTASQKNINNLKEEKRRERSAFEDDVEEMQIDTSSKKDSHQRSELLNQTNFLDVSSASKQPTKSGFSLSNLKRTVSKSKGSASSLSGEKQNYLLYQSYIDLSSEYKMNKIKLINEDFMELVRDLKTKKSQVVGYFGDYHQCLMAAEVFLQRPHPTNLQSFEEGIIAIKNDQRIALIYKAPEDVYNFNNGSDSTLQVSTFIRYLVDICEIIICVPSKNLEVNPDIKNPFQEFKNPGFSMKEMIIQPDENVSTKFIPGSIDKVKAINIQDYQISGDNSKFLSYAKFDTTIIHNEIRFKLSVNFVQCKRNGYHFYKDYSYLELRKEVMGYWPNENSYFQDEYTPRKFESSMRELLYKFVDPTHKELFEDCLKSAQDEYIQKHNELKEEMAVEYEKKMFPMFSDFFGEIKTISCQYFKQWKQELEDSKEPQQQEGFWKRVGNYLVGKSRKDKITELECDTFKCQTYHFFNFKYAFSYRYKEIHWPLLEKYYQQNIGDEHQICVHKFQKDNFDKAINRLALYCNKMNSMDRQIRYISLREYILEKVLNEVEPYILMNRESKCISVYIQFQALNIIRNAEHSITDWNISKVSVPLTHKFNKDSKLEIKMKSVYFINDTSGLILFQNTPDFKSSIYYFNIGNKASVLFNHLITLSSNDSNICVEQNLKLWCSYDNKERRANLGKLTNQGKIEDGAPITLYDQMSDGEKITSIIDALIIPFGDKLLILNENHSLFEYKWQARQLNRISRKINKGGEGIVKEYIKPSQPEDQYDQLQTTSDGKYIILKSKHSIDVYDLNWSVIKSFDLQSDFLFFKTFTDKISNFIIIFHLGNTECFQIVGLTATRTLKSEIQSKQKDKSKGNPIIDYLYHGFKKFGPHSDFIGCPSSTKLIVAEQSSLFNVDGLIKYFRNLKIQNVTIKVSEIKDILKPSFLKDDESIVDNHKLQIILLGRIALHLATIENFSLIPLQNGINISDQIAENLISEREHATDILEKIIQMIKFGIYETALVDIKSDIRVVAIVGRQSSGKSYVMNRLFGTRFNVAATRCTDGIWMSLVELYDNHNKPQLFVILDCEGLFSARRNEQEEMKLCLTLSAISDVMILNQDLSFNRYLNSLFHNFSKSIGRIKGKKLFKGYLLMLVRDVKSEESEQAYKELQSNFIQLQANKQDNFLAAVFGGDLKSQCLNYFQQAIFNDEIEEARQDYFLSINTKRWDNGRDFVESLKIVLAQVFLDDDTDMDIHKIRISCEHLYQTCIEMFYNGDEKFIGEGSVFKQDFEIYGVNYPVEVSQKSIILSSEMDTFDSDSDSTQLTEEIVKYFVNQTLEYELKIHNQWMSAFCTYLKNILEQRKIFIINYFRESMPKDQEYADVVNTYVFKLEQIFDTYIPKMQYCSKSCKNCTRLCTMRFNHKNNCNCGTSHICQDICDKTESCKERQYICVEIYGHEGDHRCNEGNHKCSDLCSIQECRFLCSEEAGHPVSKSHNCGNKHPCQQKCQDVECSRTCQFDATVEHDDHICGEERCIHKCQLCDRQCVFPNHLHQILIAKGEERPLSFSYEGIKKKLNYHICDHDHECKSNCEQKGVCSIDFQNIEKTWRNEFGEFPYMYFMPKDSRNQCNKRIKKHDLIHSDQHDCRIGSHRCSHQCPECRSFCNKEIDHDGHHHTNTHRNKENCVFVSDKGKSKVSLIADGKKREYKVGESCQPENCTSSCQRKGRAHFHLKKCLGGELCEAKINPFVKHSEERFHPFEDQVFDKWLCYNYWQSMGWEPPIEGGLLDEAQACNFYCAHSSHGDAYQFCNRNAWHNDAHKFDCEHPLQDTNIIDVVFCCDTTGSMSSYIERSKNAVKRTIDQVKALVSSVGDRSLKFAFIAYRDHPPQDSTYITRVQALSDEASVLTFINTVTAEGGGDGPEAIMDGLYDSIHKVGWRKDSLRFIFHIADAPPHGREYTGGSGDGFPSGCPCLVTIDRIAEDLKSNKIKYKLLKIGSYPNTMASVFKSKIEDYEESDLDTAIQLDLKVSEIIIKDIKSEEHDIIL